MLRYQETVPHCAFNEGSSLIFVWFSARDNDGLLALPRRWWRGALSRRSSMTLALGSQSCCYSGLRALLQLLSIVFLIRGLFWNCPLLTFSTSIPSLGESLRPPPDPLPQYCLGQGPSLWCGHTACAFCLQRTEACLFEHCGCIWKKMQETSQVSYWDSVPLRYAFALFWSFKAESDLEWLKKKWSFLPLAFEVLPLSGSILAFKGIVNGNV